MEPESTNISNLLKAIEFPEDNDPTYLLAVSGSQYRQTILKENFDDDAKIAASLEIQRVWRGYHTRCKLLDLFLRLKKSHPLNGNPQRLRTKIASALTIQKIWRRYKDRRIFLQYQKLVNFHKKGDPTLLLRCINPLEAKLLDKASRCFVRFRLGGCSFPPLIYYKIFTSRTVVDLGTFSPRNYTAMSEKKLLAREMHNKMIPTVSMDTGEWYQRWENNGWRPIVFSGLGCDVVRPEIVAPFSHLKCQRQQDIVRKRKQKRREWFMKLYTGMTTSEPKEDEEELEEQHEDIEGLVQWSNTLDYDRYINDWQTVGTSTTVDPYTVRILKKES